MEPTVSMLKIIARKARPAGIVAAIHPDHRADPATPDILVDGEYDLQEHGIEGRVVPTPGHTPDSLSVVLNSGDAFVGDMLHGKPGSLSFGMFGENVPRIRKSLKLVRSYKPARIHMSHGSYVDYAELARFTASF